MTDKFVRWLLDSMNDRGWTDSELARRSGVSQSAISLIARQQRSPGTDVCQGIARALGEDPVAVYRLAGLLPPVPAETAEAREASEIVRSLPSDVRAIAMQMLRGLRGDAPPPAMLAEDDWKEDPYAQALGDLWELASDWKKADILKQLRSEVADLEVQRSLLNRRR